MAAPTTAQVAYFRDVTGDDNPDDQLVSDAAITAYYNTAAGDVPTTIVYILRQMLAKTARRTDVRGEFGTDRLSQWHMNIRDTLLPFWEGEAGIASGGAITAGEISLGLDAVEDD